MRPSRTARWAALFCFVLLDQSAIADTFKVTSSDWSGPGSLTEAIALANANPGLDLVEFTPGLQVSTRNADPFQSPVLSAEEYVLARVTESLVIDGKGATVTGDMAWVNKEGALNDLNFLNECPESANGIQLLNESPGLLSVGVRGADNSGIEVTVRNLVVRKVNHFAYVADNASLVVEDTEVSQIWNLYRCAVVAAIQADRGASVTLRRSLIAGYRGWHPLVYFQAPVSGNLAGDLLIEDSQFVRNIELEGRRQASVFWGGSAGSTVDVISSQFQQSGGLAVDGASETRIVNSAWNNDNRFGPNIGDRFANLSSGDMHIAASSLVWNSSECLGLCEANSSQFALLEIGGSGNIELESTAIGFNFGTAAGGLALDTLTDRGAGAFSADQYTWIEPEPLGQDADTLRSITAQPELRTGSPAYAHPNIFAEMPVLVQPIVGGVLIDQVPDAGPGGANELLHPITGLPIATDVFGKPRVDANGRRNIGAVQLALGPHLHADPADGASPLARLSWTKPDANGLTGYEVCFADTTPPDPESISNCPGTSVPVAGPDTLTLDQPVAGGQDNWFLVRGVNGSSLPWSNLAMAKAYGIPTAPAVNATPGDGVVALTWSPPTDDGGAKISTYLVYYREKGATDWKSWNATTASNSNVGNLVNGVEYEFGVRAASEESNLAGPMGMASAVPQAPLFVQYATPVTISEGNALTLYPTYGNVVGSAAYAFVGAHPAWLSIDPLTGVITGTPPVTGSDASEMVTVELTRTGPPAGSATADIEIDVLVSQQGPYLTYVDHTGPAGDPVSLTPTVAGLSPPYTFSNSNTNLPPGMALPDPSSGIISGTPTTVGFWNVEMRVVDNNSQEWNNPVDITVTPTLTYPAISGTVGTPLSVLPVVPPLQSGPGYTFTMAGTLPDGLCFNPATGEISGTPSRTLTAAVDVEVSVTLPTGTFKSTTHVAVAVEGYSITFTYPKISVPDGQAFSLLPTVSGTLGNTTFAFKGPVPTGVTLDPDTGEIRGVMGPSLAGQALSVQLTDSYFSKVAGAQVERELPAPEAIEVPLLMPGGLALLALVLIAVGWIQLHRVRT